LVDDVAIAIVIVIVAAASVAVAIAVANDAIAAAIAVAVVVGKEEDSWDTGARGPVRCSGTWKDATTIGNGNRIERA